MHIAGAGAVRQAQNIPIADRVRVDGTRQKQKKGNQERRIVAVDFAFKRVKRIFHLSTSRHAVYCRAALESTGVAHCGRLR